METPLKCKWIWVHIALELGTPFMCLHPHLMYMMGKITSRQEKKVFNVCQVHQRSWATLQTIMVSDPAFSAIVVCTYTHLETYEVAPLYFFEVFDFQLQYNSSRWGQTWWQHVFNSSTQKAE